MRKLISIFCFIFISLISIGQSKIKVPAPSPQQVISISYGDDEVSVDYSRIRLRNRKFFGEGKAFLYPYGKIWRTGANTGTKLTFSKDVMVDEKILPKGSYVLLSWPGKDQWEVSFYKDLKIGGQVELYDKKNEALRLLISPQQPEKPVETMTVAFSRTGTNSGIIHFAMENTLLKIPFTLLGNNTSDKTTVTTTQSVGIDKISLKWNSDLNKIKIGTEFLLGTIQVADETEFGGEPVPTDVYSFYINTVENKIRFSGTKGKEFKLTPFRAAADKVFNPATYDLSISFSHLPEDNKTVFLKIDVKNTSYTLPITCEFESKVMKTIGEAMKSPDFAEFSSAAIFYLENGKDLKQALIWIDKAFTVNPQSFWNLYQKAKIQYALGDYANAIATAKQSIEISKNANNADYVKMNLEFIALAEAKLQSNGGMIIPNTGPAGSNPQVTTGNHSNSNPAGNRYALVIGIKSYTNSAPLTNTLNDAKDMTALLKKLGFIVIELLDPETKRDIQDAVRKYYTTLSQHKDATGLVFYSGHGMQVDGSNYLIPASASMQIKADIEDQCVNMNYIMEAIEEAKNPLNIFILDACRNNPFKSFDRSGERGLTLVSAPAGSYIVYATKPGSVASDGTGSNGLFTSSLLKYISTPNMSIEQVFKNVARDVITESNNAQRPWISSDYVGDFYFSR